MREYHFEEPHIIVGYRNEQFVGVMITYPAETFTTDELLDIFEMGNPTCLVAEVLPAFEEEITPDNYMDLLEDMILAYVESSFTELNSDLLYIPKTLR